MDTSPPPVDIDRTWLDFATVVIPQLIPGQLTDRLAALRPAGRLVLWAVDVRGLSQKDAAELLGYSPAYVRWQLSQARRSVNPDRPRDVRSFNSGVAA